MTLPIYSQSLLQDLSRLIKKEELGKVSMLAREIFKAFEPSKSPDEYTKIEAQRLLNLLEKKILWISTTLILLFGSTLLSTFLVLTRTFDWKVVVIIPLQISTFKQLNLEICAYQRYEREVKTLQRKINAQET